MGIAAVLVVFLHILFSIFVLLTPGKHNAKSLGKLYNQLVLLGPFFTESRIKTSPHLYISFKVKDTWSPFVDHGLANFKSYCQHPWRYGKLHYGDFERYISLQIGEQIRHKEFKGMGSSRAFRELNQFIVQEVISRQVDSVSLVYGLNVYLPETKTVRFDTVFKYTYNPSAIAPSKKL